MSADTTCRLGTICLILYLISLSPDARMIFLKLKQIGLDKDWHPVENVRAPVPAFPICDVPPLSQRRE
jgi:hypothetical protein